MVSGTLGFFGRFPGFPEVKCSIMAEKTGGPPEDQGDVEYFCGIFSHHLRTSRLLQGPEMLPNIRCPVADKSAWNRL